MSIRNAQVDIFFSQGGPADVASLLFRNMLVIGELMSSYDDKRFKADLLQLARYARNTFIEQPLCSRVLKRLRPTATVTPAMGLKMVMWSNSPGYQQAELQKWTSSTTSKQEMSRKSLVCWHIKK